MASPHFSPNRHVLVEVAKAVQPMLPELVFVGGQVAELLITAPGANRIRPTVDVDLVVKATTQVEYEKICDRLRAFGLQNDSGEGAPICRWKTQQGLKLDVMPLDEGVLGFGSRWYPGVVQHAIPHQLLDDLTILISPAPLYLATKWEAFLSRGQSDYLRSHDLEDIISVVAGRPEVLAEISETDPEVQEWVAHRTSDFLAHESADYALLGALPDSATIPGLVGEVRSRFEAIVAIAQGN